MKLFSQLILALATPVIGVNGATIFNISQITIDDGGTPLVLTSSSTNADYGSSGNADLLSFTANGTQYSTDNYLSAVRISSASVSGVSGLIQPADHLADGDPLFNTPTGAFYTGSSDPASYLSHGERGLSLNTALNLTPQDDPVVMRVGIDIFDASAMTDSIPDFVFGDGANNQSADIVRFLAANGTDVIAEVTLDPTTAGDQGDWYQFGTRNVDRLFPDGNGFRIDGDGSASAASSAENPNIANDTPLEVNLIAFSLESSDLTTFGQSIATFEDALEEIAFIEFVVPGSGDEPRTDYAFFALNINAIDSPDLVPEPSSYTLIFGVAAILTLAVRRRR